MDAYCAEVHKLEKHFQGLEILHVMRDLNIVADVLAKLGSDRAQLPPDVFVQELQVPTIKQEASTSMSTLTPDVQVLVVNPTWMQVFIDYIRDHKLPDDKVEAEHITCRSKNYVLVGDMLYRQGESSGVLLKCITPKEGQKILEEIHSGCCGTIDLQH